MASALAPATDAIMGSLPAAKMSVGSAINDTTRVAGGALGVAVLGSILASGYRGGMDSAVSGLPAEARDIAHDSLAGGLAVAERLGRRAARGDRAGRVPVRHAHGGAGRGRGRARRRGGGGGLPAVGRAFPGAGGRAGVRARRGTESGGRP